MLLTILGEIKKRVTVRRVAAATLVVMAFLWLRGCWKDTIIPTFRPSENTSPVPTPLPPEDQLRVWTGDNRIIVQDKQKVTNRYVPPAGSASVIVKKDGRVDIEVKQIGPTLEPGLGVMVSDKLRLTMDARFFYLGRFGLVGGLGVGNYSHVLIGYGGVSYGLDQLGLSNTSLLVGYTTRQEVGVGIRVRL